MCAVVLFWLWIIWSGENEWALVQRGRRWEWKVKIAFSGLHSPLQEVYRHFNFSSTHLYVRAPNASSKEGGCAYSPLRSLSALCAALCFVQHLQEEKVERDSLIWKCHIVLQTLRKSRGEKKQKLKKRPLILIQQHCEWMNSSKWRTCTFFIVKLPSLSAK